MKKRWFVTGCAGFIGSNLVKTLLLKGEEVVGVDNLATGKLVNIDRLLSISDRLFEFQEGDILDRPFIDSLLFDVDVVVHLAAQASVQKSFADVMFNNRQNVDGFITMLLASKEAGVAKFVYASSCAVYGETQELPIHEQVQPSPLSPYATSKLMNDLYAANLRSVLKPMEICGLRFFNVFGPYQDPNGDYAAVIPRWVESLMSGEQPTIFGDGAQTRDFCYVGNICEFILQLGRLETGISGTYNICSGQATSLNLLFETIRSTLEQYGRSSKFELPGYQAFRPGDIVHSLGSADKAAKNFRYTPKWSLQQGLNKIFEEQYELSPKKKDIVGYE